MAKLGNSCQFTTCLEHSQADQLKDAICLALQKKNKYNQLISKLKDRNTLLSAKVEELNIEKDYLK